MMHTYIWVNICAAHLAHSTPKDSLMTPGILEHLAEILRSSRAIHADGGEARKNAN